MVSECANPRCSAQFLYFGEGQLVAVPRKARFSNQSRVEFFWLCGECTNLLELQITPEGEVDVVARQRSRELEVG
jgi:hypothetical protein